MRYTRRAEPTHGDVRRAPKIYATTLDTLRIDATAALFVGDTYLPDFFGPERAGITAVLIDPHRQAPVPDARRLNSIIELPARLRAQLNPDQAKSSPEHECAIPTRRPERREVSQ